MAILRRCFVLAAAASLAGCSEDVGQPVDWKSLDLPEKRLELQHSRKAEIYAFTAQGLVQATYGIKDGPITAPLLYWRIDRGDLVLSEWPGADAKPLMAFREPSIKGDMLTVKRTSGETVRFLVRKQ